VPVSESIPNGLARVLARSGRIRIGREYRSQMEVLGLPLVHIATGINLETGRVRVAKGVIAIGNIAFGLLAFGGIAVGILPLGGLAFGPVALGGLAVGVFSFGGCAVGLLFAVGGAAIGYVAIGGGAVGYYALGAGAAGVHVIDQHHCDPMAQDFFVRWFGQWILPAGARPPTP